LEWEKQYGYRATVVNVVSAPGQPEVEVEGDDTPTVPAFAHDVFPPAVPTGLQAVFSGVGQTPFVDLVWSPDTEADLAGYNIFRHEENEPPVKLNSEPVKAPAFRDSNVQSGKKYFYSVSAVDERNNESAKSEETSEQVP
jgi:fibronectin type 3 domain-containing protein